MAVLNTKGVTSSALKKILATLTENREKVSGKKMVAMQHERFSEAQETIVLPLVGGGEVQWEVARPSALVSMAVRLSIWWWWWWWWWWW